MNRYVESGIVAIAGLLCCLTGIALHFELSPLSFELFGLMAMWLAPVPAILIAIIIFVAHLLIKDSSVRWIATLSLLATEVFIGELSASVTDF